MFRHLLLPAVFIGFFLSQATLAAAPAGFWQNPVIKNAGAMHPVPEGAFQPQKDATYKAVFSITEPEISKGDKNAAYVNQGLDAVARAVNIFASAGVPPDHLKFVVIVHGGATPAVLDNAHYKQEFGVDNPNLTLIKQLKAVGVQLVVCGQAMAAHKYEDGR